MKIYTIAFLIIALTTTSCSAQDTYIGYVEEQVTQDIIDNLEKGECSRCEQLPSIIKNTQEDIRTENLLDRFPFRKYKNKEEPESGDSDDSESFFTGDIIRKFRYVIVNILDSFSLMVSITLYLFPVAIITYFVGFFLYGISSSVHGAASLKRGILKFQNKPPYNLPKE